MKRPAGPRYALISPTGYGNLGDAAALDAVIDHIRRRQPAASFVGVTLNPADTRRRHGIEAVSLAGTPVAGYSAGFEVAAPTSLLGRARAVAGVGRRELRHWRGGRVAMRGVSAVIMAGGAQLDDFWGGPWGHPWALAKWSLLGRLAGARVLFLGTGVGSLESPVSRALVRSALRRAHLRTFRDEGSRDLMAGFGFDRGDPLQPDLAFGHPGFDRPGEKTEGRPRTVAIAPMAFRDPRGWPDPEALVFESYLDRLAEIGSALASRGDRVLLLASAGSDHRVAKELADRIRRRCPEAAGAVEVDPTDQVDGYLTAAGRADVLVGSRLHGVLLSLLVGTPAVALSYERKVEVLMEQCGATDACLDIAKFSPDGALALVDRVLETRDQRRAVILSRVGDFRRTLDTLFDQWFPASG